jgi:transketolase
VDFKRLKSQAKKIRKKVLDLCLAAGSGHVSSMFSSVEILTALYYSGIMRYRSDDPDWENRDRFVMSKAHIAGILYVILADRGFFAEKELKKYMRGNTVIGSHVQREVPGCEITAGSLGNGLGISAGMAYAARMDGKKHGIFTLMGDAECQEGSVWESAMFAGHQGLGNLTAIVDRNSLGATGFTEKVNRLCPFRKKWEAFNWRVIEIDGHDFKQIISALKKASSGSNRKPTVIIAHTVKGKGIRFIENKVFWHGVVPKGIDAEKARAILAC